MTNTSLFLRRGYLRRTFRRLLFTLTIAILSPAAFAGSDFAIVGDSHSAGSTGPFGQCLEANLKKRGQSVSRYAVGAADSASWLRKSFCTNPNCKPFTGWHAYPGHRDDLGPVPKDFPNIDRIVATHPKSVVIALGTNDISNICHSHLTGKKRYEAIGKLIDKADPSKRGCFWVGPPAFKSNGITRYCKNGEESDENALYDREVSDLQDFVESKKCTFVDSRLIKRENGKPLPPPVSDPHIYDRGADKGVGCTWAAAVAEKITHPAVTSEEPGNPLRRRAVD